MFTHSKLCTYMLQDQSSLVGLGDLQISLPQVAQLSEDVSEIKLQHLKTSHSYENQLPLYQLLPSIIRTRNQQHTLYVDQPPYYYCAVLRPEFLIAINLGVKTINLS